MSLLKAGRTQMKQTTLFKSRHGRDTGKRSEAAVLDKLFEHPYLFSTINRFSVPNPVGNYHR